MPIKLEEAGPLADEQLFQDTTMHAYWERKCD